MNKLILWMLLFLGLLSPWVKANWVWTPETGWVNTRYDPRGTARHLFNRGQELYEQKRYDEAAEAFKDVVKYYSATPEGEEALYLAAESLFAVEQYYGAYSFYEEYLQKFPSTPYLQKILQCEYEIGLALLQSKGASESLWGVEFSSRSKKGIEILENLVLRAPYLSFADDAQMAVANCHFAAERYEEAQSAYEKIVEKYPQSEWHALAQYQVAICALKQFRGVDYDAEPLRTAQQKLERYFLNHPDGQEREAARQKSYEVEEAMAQKKLNIAIFYLDWDYLHSGKLYLYLVIRQHPDTRAAQKAKLLLRQYP